MESGFDPVVWIEKHFPGGFPDAVPLHPFPAIAIKDRHYFAIYFNHDRHTVLFFQTEQATLNEKLHR